MMLFTLFSWWTVAGALIFILIVASFFKDDRKLTHDADYGNPSDVLSRWSNKGFTIDGVRRLSKTDSFRNVMVCGSVGSYKSSSIAIPFLKEVDDAFLVVNDISDELLPASGPELQEKGFDILVVKLRHPDSSHGYNPLHRCQTKGQINRVASSIVESSLKGQGDPFWSKSAISMIAIFISLLKARKDDSAHLPNVLRLLKVFQGDPSKIDKLFANVDEELYIDYRALVGTSEKTLSSITASAIASLQIVEDTDVARVICTDTLGDFKELRRKKTAIFIQNSVLDIDYLRFVSDLFFEQLIESIIGNPVTKDDLSTFFVLDEFASSMKIQNAGRIFATLRKTKTGILAITQNGKSQLLQNYSDPEAQSIVSNCATKVWLSGGLDIESAKHIERVGGRFEAEDEDGKMKSRMLITESEALLIPPKQGILEMSGHPLMKIKLTPFFERLKYQDKKRQPIELQGGVPQDVPMISIT